MKVADDQADGWVGLIAVYRLIRGECRYATVSLGLQELAQLFDDDRLIIDYQHFHFTYRFGHDQLPVNIRPCSRARRSGRLKVAVPLVVVQGVYKIRDRWFLHWIHTAVRR
ncbi:hypothetical protein EDP1_3893 [Pseudomonas putida S610]|nr:hypothetical protein EDP1_3893 [Pseudomonas putida S610]